MATRQKMRNKRLDRRVFEVTANRVHKKNLVKTYSKGGIRE